MDTDLYAEQVALNDKLAACVSALIGVIEELSGHVALGAIVVERETLERSVSIVYEETDDGSLRLERRQ